MKRIGGAVLLIVIGMAIGARAQMASGNPYYVDGLLVEEYRQPEILPSPQERPRTMSLRDVPPPAPAAPPPQGAPIGRPGPPALAPPLGKALEQFRIAEMLVQKQDWKGALEAIQKGLEFEPTSNLLLRRGAALAALTKNYVLADDYFRRLLMTTPDGVEFINGRASVQLRLRQFVQAQILNDRALELQPDNLLARFNRLLLRILRNDNLDAESWNNLLTAEVNQVANWLDADRAELVELMTPAGYAKACDIALGPGLSEKVRDVVNVLRRLAQAQQLRQWDKALGIIEEARQMGLSAMGLEMDEARGWLENGDQAKAHAIMKGLAERYPDHPQVQYNYAYVLIEEGSYAEALAPLDRAFQKAPRHPQITFARVCMLAEAGRADEAWPLLTQLMQAFPAETRTWLQEEQPYLKKIKADPRFPSLLNTRPAKKRGSVP